MAVKQKEGEKQRIEQCYVAANLISVAIKNQATETRRKGFIRRRQLLYKLPKYLIGCQLASQYDVRE